MADEKPEGVQREVRELPRSLVALVHDVELNQAAWWDLATKRIVEAALWMTGAVPSTHLARMMKDEFGVQLPSSEIERLLSLEPRHVVKQNGASRLTEAATAEFTPGFAIVAATLSKALPSGTNR